VVDTASIGDLSQPWNAVLFSQEPEDAVAELFLVSHQHFDGTGGISRRSLISLSAYPRCLTVDGRCE
jgi:hypothetical protein